MTRASQRQSRWSSSRPWRRAKSRWCLQLLDTQTSHETTTRKCPQRPMFRTTTISCKSQRRGQALATITKLLCSIIKNWRRARWCANSSCTRMSETDQKFKKSSAKNSTDKMMYVDICRNVNYGCPTTETLISTHKLQTKRNLQQHNVSAQWNGRWRHLFLSPPYVKPCAPPIEDFIKLGSTYICFYNV